ncbi:MAG: nucleoside deaminase [Acidobacteriota bacterium]|nr:nucleoside deaminase [Acidobacteriota bacterium]
MLPEWVFDEHDRAFMTEALGEAEAAGRRGEIPVGAVVARGCEVISRAGNRRMELHDPAAHAELLALAEAGRVVGDWRLEDCTLYVTLEPCPMCAAACRQARLGLVVWGAPDPQAGACGSVMNLAEDPRLGRPLTQRGGLDAEASRRLLRGFFAKQRHSS